MERNREVENAVGIGILKAGLVLLGIVVFIVVMAWFSSQFR